MLSHLFDTSVYCQPLKPKPLPSVIKRWSRLDETQIAISVICHAELHQGLLAKNSDKLWLCYKQSLKHRFPILDITPRVAEQFARLRVQHNQNGKPRPLFDLLIAATVITHHLTLATCNIRDFAGIEGLACEDWSVD